MPIKNSIIELDTIANNIRKDLIKSLLAAGSGHSAGPLGTADIFTALYFNILNIDPKNPHWEDRDRFVLSCGHICPVFYTTLAHRGFFSVDELKSLRKLGSILQGHPHNLETSGVENSSGPLGQGLSQAVGMALARRIDNKNYHVFALLSDGEHQEGQTWESIMFAGKERLGHLIAIVDRNNIQIDGPTEEICALEPFKEKYEAFNWHVLEVDGHNIEGIIDACNFGKSVYDQPTVIIAHTVPGKGVEFMEEDFHWHGMPPNKEQAKIALSELRTLGNRIRSEHE